MGRRLRIVPRDGVAMRAATSGRIVARGALSPSWAELGAQARVFRIVHTAWAMANLASLGHVWRCALTGRRDRALAASVAMLSLEGVALVIGRGDCPFGPFQRRLGDPVPLFELVLPPRAARAAIPVLTVVAAAGIIGVAVRGVVRPPGSAG